MRDEKQRKVVSAMIFVAVDIDILHQGDQAIASRANIAGRDAYHSSADKNVSRTISDKSTNSHANVPKIFEMRHLSSTPARTCLSYELLISRGADSSTALAFTTSGPEMKAVYRRIAMLHGQTCVWGSVILFPTPRKWNRRVRLSEKIHGIFTSLGRL